MNQSNDAVQCPKVLVNTLMIIAYVRRVLISIARFKQLAHRQ